MNDEDFQGYHVLKCIGRGQFATAHLIQNKEGTEVHVAKVIPLANLGEKDQKLAEQEVDVLRRLRHQYVVEYRESFFCPSQPSTLVIVMEYCECGELRALLLRRKQEKQLLHEQQIMPWFTQVCLGLQYIHGQKILHRDLKTANLFLCNNFQSIKLGDFGISRILSGTCSLANTTVGTPQNMAPEACRQEPYREKSDIWALGCVLYEMVTLRHAFASPTLMGMVYRIVSDSYDPIPGFYSQDVDRMLKGLLAKAPEERPTTHDILTDEFVKPFLPAGFEVESTGPPRAPSPPPDFPGYTPEADPTSTEEEDSELLFEVLLLRMRLCIPKGESDWAQRLAGGDGAVDTAAPLTMDHFNSAMANLQPGLSSFEIDFVAGRLVSLSSPEHQQGGLIQLTEFSKVLAAPSAHGRQIESWAKKVAQVIAKNAGDLSVTFGSEATLSEAEFGSRISALMPGLAPEEVRRLVHLATRTLDGEVEWSTLFSLFGIQ